MGACGRRPTLVRCWGAHPCPADHRAGRHADHADRLWHQRPAAADIWVDRYCGGRFCGAEHDAERRVGAADRECEGERGCSAAAPSPCLLTSGAHGGGSRMRHWRAGRASTGSCPGLAPPASLARWQTAQTVQAALAAQTALAACLRRCSAAHAALCAAGPAAQYSTRPFIVGDRVQLKSLSGSTIAMGGAGAACRCWGGRGEGCSRGASAAGRGLVHGESLGAQGPADAVQTRRVGWHGSRACP